MSVPFRHKTVALFLDSKSLVSDEKIYFIRHLAYNLSMTLNVTLNEDFKDLYLDALVNTVSCQGVQKSPHDQALKRAAFSYYKHCKRLRLRKKLVLSEPNLFIEDVLFGTRSFVTLPIKLKWLDNPTPESVKRSLDNLKNMFEEDKSVRSFLFLKFDGPPEGWLESELRKRFEESKIQSIIIC